MSEQPSPEIAVRDATAADRAAVERLDDIGTAIAKPEYWTDMFRRYVASSRPGRHFLVAEVAGEFVGFVVGEIRTWEFGSAPCGWVFAVNVAPELRERGIGAHLFQQICRRFATDGVDTVRTMISRNDTLILSFFRSQGLIAGPYIELECRLD